MPEGRLEWTMCVVGVLVTVAVTVYGLARYAVGPTAGNDSASSAPASSSSTPVDSDFSPSPSPSPPPSTDQSAEPSEPEDGTGLEIGDTFIGEQADTTLLRAQRLRPPSELAVPPEQELFGIRAETCMHLDANPSGQIRLSGWVLEDEVGRRYLGAESAWEDFPAQQYSPARLGPGECNEGWVLVTLPPGTAPNIRKVMFRPISAQWTVDPVHLVG